MFHSRRRAVSFAAAIVLTFSLAPNAAETLVISPTTFDFGWSPDNAKISAEFTIKNTGVAAIPINSVQPTCGCTVPQFTPGTLATNEETKATLTFNTRGYAGSSFHKSAKVKTDSENSEYSVLMTGYVLDPNAKVVPDQNGTAGFEPGSKEKKKTIKIQNKSDKDVTLSVVQSPASWATAKLQAASVKAGASINLEISAEGPYDQTKETSVTYEVAGLDQPARFTVAIRTGTPPTPVRAVVPPAPAASPKASPVKK